jgi:hypothetical protein
MKEFMKAQVNEVEEEPSLMPPCYDMQEYVKNSGKTFFVETHGCQMNVSDTEIVETIL